MFDDSIMSMSDYFMRTYRFFYWHVKLNELKYTEVEFYNIEGARQFMRVFREEDNPSGYWRKLLSMTKQHEMFIYSMSDDEVEHEIAKMLDKGYIKVCLETVNHSPFGGDYDPDDTGEITCYDPTTYKKISDDRAIRKPENRTQEKPASQKENKPKADSSKSSESSKPQVQENTATTSNAPGTTLTGQPAPATAETCTNGCPISMVTGEELLEQTDFTLSGPLPLKWTRTYRTSNPTDNQLGYGWTHPLNEKLTIHDDVVKYLNQEGREIIFPLPALGSSSRNITTDLTLTCDKEDHYCLTDKNGLKKIFIGNEQAKLQLIQDNFENTIRIHWGNYERPTRIATSWGKQLWITHTPSRRIASIIPGTVDEQQPTQPALVSYEYDRNGDLIKITDNGGGSHSFYYNNHIITQRTLPSGLSYYFEWDKFEPTGKCLHNWGDKGLYDYHFEWYPEENRSVSTDSRGGRFEYEYNNHGKITREIDPYGNETLTGYSKTGKVTYRIDPTKATTRYSYDSNDNLTEVTDSEGNVHQIKYDKSNRPIKLIDPLNNEWQRQYNKTGALAQTVDPQGNKTQYHYNDMGFPNRIINAKGQSRTLEWDDRGRLTSETDFAGNLSIYGYDDNDQISTIRNPDGKTTSYSYDKAGRVESAILPDGKQTRISYDTSGNITGITDAAGRTTSFEYSGMTQLTRRIDPNGQTLDYLYDTEENLVGLKNENGELYQLHYDLNENLIKEIGFDGRVQKYEYDAAGRLIKYQQGDNLPEEIEPDQEGMLPPIITQFTRNSLGQLLSTQNGDGSGNQFAYDPLGRLIKAVNKHRQLTYSYDKRGLLVEEKQDDHAITHQYDELGLRTNTILPDGQKLDFQFNALGAYESIHLNDTLLTQIKRDQLGREMARTQGATLTEQQYDHMGRLSQIKVANRQNRQVMIQRDYGYDEAGNLSFINDLKKGETRFHYDAINRLTAMQGVIDETFAHDPAGNILNNNGESAQVTKGNRLAFQGDRHFEYDDRGNLIREKRGKGGQLTTEFEYNDQNQLTKVTKGKQETEYQYDPLGRRISKKDNFGETRFLWNGNQLLSESRGEINKTYLFEPGGFRPLAFVQDQKVYHYHVDHLGTPQEISNEQGEIVWSVQYRAYGNVVKKEIEQIENNLRFQGQYFDEETGLHYNRFRYYNPTTGRFINQDPIGLLGGMNNYQYAPNPTGWVDPFGLTCKLAKKIQEKANKGNIREITQGKVCEKGYHGRLTKERMLEIVREPDGVYISTEGYQNVIFAKDGDIVVFAGDKAGAFKGQAITSYGPSGPRGESGSVIHGGSPNDSGLPITEEMIVNGQIPTPSGGFLAPANKIFI